MLLIISRRTDLSLEIKFLKKIVKLFVVSRFFPLFFIYHLGRGMHRASRKQKL